MFPIRACRIRTAWTGSCVYVPVATFSRWTSPVIVLVFSHDAFTDDSV